jgi:putative membrane protein
VKQLFIRWVVVALGVLAAAYIVPGIDVDSSEGLLAVIAMALVLGIVNTLVRPLVKLLALPLIAVTLGLFLLVINAAMFALASWLLPSFSVDGFIAALEGSIIVSIVGWLMSFIVPDAKDN